MQALPLVTVIIPCYNVSCYIEKAIRSIIEQTHTNLEILIIDDASTDDTLKKIKTFNDSRIRVIEFLINTQKIGAVNSVLKEAKGTFICFQDADDWSEPERLEKQVKEFEKQATLGICFTGYRYVGGKTGVPGRIAVSNGELRNEFLEFGYKKNVGFNPTVCATMMIAKTVLEKTGGYNPYFIGRVAEDIHWIYRILKEFKGITVDEVLYNYNFREGSFTHQQYLGRNAKYAYSWQLVSAIIHKDLSEQLDVLDPKNIEKLKLLELKACEEALIEKINECNTTRSNYENSRSYKLGSFLLAPMRFLKKKK